MARWSRLTAMRPRRVDGRTGWWGRSASRLLPVLLPRLQDLAVQPDVLQHRLAVLLGGVLDKVVEEALAGRGAPSPPRVAAS